MVSKNIGQAFGMPLHWKPRVVMTPTLSSPRWSLWWQLAGITVMTKLALRQFSILGITHGLVNIRITIAIHWHSQRFLESESLSYYRVLNTLVRVTDSAQHSASHFEQWIQFLWQMSHKCVNWVLGCLEIMILVYPDPFRQAILCRNRTGINPMMQAGCGPILAHYGISARMWCFVKMKTFCSIRLCLVTRQSFYSIVYRMW